MENPLQRRILCVLISLSCLIGLTGCGYKDIDKRYFVLNIGIDHHEGKEPYTVSIKVAVPSEEGGQSGSSSNQSTVLSVNTTSISQGIELLKTQLEKQLDFGHAKVLLVDPYVAQHDMPTLASWFIQRKDIQKIAYVAIAKPSSKEIMNTKPDTEKMPSGTLLLMFGDTGAISPYINTQYLFNFYRELYEKGKTAVLPIIEENNNRLQVKTVGVFKHQKLVAELTPKETLFLNTFINKGHNFYINEAVDGRQSVASLQGIRTHIFLHTRSAIPYADVQVKASGDLGLPSETVTIQDNIKMEKKVNQKMENDIQKLLATLQKKGVDPIGMGLIYCSHHLNQEVAWKNWQAIYPTLKFKVHVYTKFKENGISG